MPQNAWIPRLAGYKAKAASFHNRLGKSHGFGKPACG
jgi:hypothetical protein